VGSAEEATAAAIEEADMARSSDIFGLPSILR
jgi:hypothetical protein